MNFSRCIAAAVFVATLIFQLSAFSAAADRPAQWKAVEEAQKVGQPKTASAALDKIITDAIADKVWPEAVRAILAKTQFDAATESYREQSAAIIGALKQWLSEQPPVDISGNARPPVPASMRPLLEAAFAKTWWAYYQANRWQLLERTQTETSPSDDFLTWDARRVLAEAAFHFEAALADPVTLQKTPIATLEPLLAKGELPDAYRPTLYDFIVHEAIAFYSAGEQGVSQSEDHFELSADSPIFGMLEEFLAWQPEPARGKTSPTLRAIQLYQQVLRFHQNDANQTALADADLNRIQWAAETLDEPAEERAVAALRAFVKRWRKNHAATSACLLLAEHFGDNDNFAEAHAAALEGVRLHPGAPDANACRNIISKIEAPELEGIATETTWAEPWPEIAVSYRNLKRIYFRAIPVSWTKTITGEVPDFEDSKFKLNSRKPAKSWSVNLPATADFERRVEKVPAPRDLKPGFYVIAASLNKDFSKDNNVINGAPVWVSDLAIVDGDANADNVAGFVVNATTGEPVSEATVTLWNPKKRDSENATFTDANGAFSITAAIEAGNDRVRYLHARAKDGREIGTMQELWFSRPVANRPAPPDRDYVYFFTDRSIYRPGQSMQFKVVAMRVSGDSTKHTLLTDYKIFLQIRDPNGKAAGDLKLQTNAFGSASGSFDIVAGRLAGSYTLSSVGLASGSVNFQVEEYKRPKFEVTLARPEVAPKLDDTVSLTGVAASYTGAPIDGAKVTWRVRRVIRWPHWCWWFMPVANNNREIAHGMAQTDAFGKFTLQFTAHADKATDPKDEPIFDYAITAEVTDTTGETRDASLKISVGYTALSATISKASWQTANEPVKLRIRTTTLDGVAQSAKGSVTIYPLLQPESVPQPELPGFPQNYYPRSKAADKRKVAPSDPRGWEEGEPMEWTGFTTNSQNGSAEVTFKLPGGIYRAIVTTRDRFGKSVTARSEIRVLDLKDNRHNIKEAFSLAAPRWKAQPGDTFVAYWGSGYESARAFVRIEQEGRVLRSFWTERNATRQKIELPITEEMRGGVTMNIFQVRDNRLVARAQDISIPREDRSLKITWEHFNSKLVPGGRETWTARIAGPDAEPAAAELCASLYDASLDQYYKHYWTPISTTIPVSFSRYYYKLTSNPVARFREIAESLNDVEELDEDSHTYWSWSILPKIYANESITLTTGGLPGGAMAITSQRAAAAQDSDIVHLERFTVTTERYGLASSVATAASAGTVVSNEVAPYSQSPEEIEPVVPPIDLSTVTARKNLNETAFFFPQLLTDSDGSVRMEFTVPEALTRWKFLGFAHDKQLRSAILTDTAVTAKDLMVQPNPPRFLREGDTVEFTVKITNMTDKPQTGSAQLTFADASTLEPVNLSAGSSGTADPAMSSNHGRVARATQPFTLAPNSSQTLSWRITIPDGQGFLTYKAVASTGTVSDGEEGFLPVLSRRQLVTESITLPIRDKGTYTFRFDKLATSEADTGTAGVPPAQTKAGKMPALPVSQSLTVQMTSNPAWYAVLALPNLMEFPHECSEQIFNRYYANALAAHIANSDPKIARVFEQWRNTPALDSPLLQNEELKSVLIEETPWLRTATRESEQRRAIGNLFEPNRTAAQTDSIVRTLVERQGADGLWAWFPGGRGNEYITRYLVAGFARLRHFGIPLDSRADAMLKRAIPALDAAFAKQHAELLASKNFNPDGNHLDSSAAYQLYTRSFFLKEIPIPDTARVAYDFYTEQARKHWLTLPRQSQGHTALALARLGDTTTPAAIVESLKQRAKTSDELGMWWADASRGWFWWQAPIETHALMIEVFDEVARDAQVVADLQLWLLKQKQTQAWPSTKATADAVYALLLRGTDKLASDALVSVTLGDGTQFGSMGILPMSGKHGTEHGQDARATQGATPGTGFYSQRIPGSSVIPAMGEKITVTKTDAGPAWGSVTWQYLQTIDKITPHEGTPLTLKKTLWKQINTKDGPTLIQIFTDSSTVNRKLQTGNHESGRLEPGDTLIARIELRTDRDMEFVHLKDQRGSGTEPVNVLSGYRWKNGLGYYESTRDTATHFFMDWLPAGTHVFEYPVRVQLRGRYESGIAEIQCMYAPEYNSHSASTTLVVE